MEKEKKQMEDEKNLKKEVKKEMHEVGTKDTNLEQRERVPDQHCASHGRAGSRHG